MPWLITWKSPWFEQASLMSLATHCVTLFVPSEKPNKVHHWCLELGLDIH